MKILYFLAMTPLVIFLVTILGFIVNKDRDGAGFLETFLFGLFTIGLGFVVILIFYLFVWGFNGLV